MLRLSFKLLLLPTERRGEERLLGPELGELFLSLDFDRDLEL